MSSKFDIKHNHTWKNEHNNISQNVQRLYEISNNTATQWREGLAGIQKMLGQVRSRSERVRSFGGRWSLSKVAVCKDAMLDTTLLSFYGTVGANSIAGEAIYDDPMPLNKRLFYFQTGAQVSQINWELEQRGTALATTGASNGQTLAGAVSTGTHGSALNIGAMQDYVRALHFVTSDKEHVIIQPASRPIVNSNFSNVFGAKLINADELFKSAVVSFGSFGVIHGIIVETVSLYMLKAYSMRVDYDQARKVYPYLANFDHSSNTNLKPFLQEMGLPHDTDPYHLDIIANPYADKKNAFLRLMYKLPYDQSQLSPEPSSSSTRVGDDILSMVGAITNVAGSLVPTVVNTLFGNVAEEQSGYIQTPRNIFGDSTIYRPENGGASSELGVPIGIAAEAVDLVMQTAKDSTFAGMLGIRFVKNTEATLGFTRFSPLTCTIELPGLNSPGTRTFYDHVFTAMDDAGHPFTLHWGQEGDYSADRLNKMYGDSVDKWLAERKKMLPDPMQRYMFSNAFLMRCGLGDALPLDDGSEIA